MRGTRVVVRALHNTPLLRRVWEVTDTAIYICSEENYRLLNRGGQRIMASRVSSYGCLCL